MSEQAIKFFGAYVSSINSQVGWGGENSACSFVLAEDPKDGSYITLPKVGTACYFQYGGFSFGGILQKWTYKESVEQGRTYEVVLESPSKVLDGVYIILNEFQGTVYSDANVDTPYTGKEINYGNGNPTNIINVFADKENYQHGGLFGAADVNSLGYPVKNIVSDIATCIKRSIFGGKIYYGESQYNLDLSELQTVIDQIPDYRVNNFITDLNSLIRDICEKGVADYLVTIKPGSVTDKNVANNPTIYIKTILRKSDPAPGIVKQKIDEFKAAGTLSSYSLGKELADSVTQKVLLGGPASRYWFANQNYILPIWGSLGIGENAQYFYGNSIQDYFDLDTKIRVTIDGGYEGNFTTVDTDLLEIRCAKSSREAWACYHLLKAIKNKEVPIALGGMKFTLDFYMQALEGKLGPNDLMDTSMPNAEIAASYLYGNWQDVQSVHLQRLMNARYQAVAAAANNFYGKKFLVSMPLENGGQPNNYRWIKQDNVGEYSWDISHSAWAGEKAMKQINDKAFYDGVGRLIPVAVYADYKNVDYSSMHGYGRINDPFTGVVVQANIDESFKMRFLDSKFVNVNNKVRKDSAGKPITSAANTIVYCVVELDCPEVYDQYTTQYNGFNILAKKILDVGGLSYFNLAGFNAIDFAICPSPLLPEYVGVPQESNRYVWGPWFSIAADNGNKGKALVIQDSQFTPETFGTTADMDTHAKTYVNCDLAQIYESESGWAEVAGIPQYNLADRFASSGPYITGISLSVSTGGITSTYSFMTWTRKAGAMAKYNVERIGRTQSSNFQYLQKIRNLYRNPPPTPVSKDFFGAMEKKFRQMLPRPNSGSTVATQGIFGNFLNAAARSVNGYNIGKGTFPSVNVQSQPVLAAKESFAQNYKESFGSSHDQHYSMGFVFDQRRKDQAIEDFNS